MSNEANSTMQPNITMPTPISLTTVLRAALELMMQYMENRAPAADIASIILSLKSLSLMALIIMGADIPISPMPIMNIVSCGTMNTNTEPAIPKTMYDFSIVVEKGYEILRLMRLSRNVITMDMRMAMLPT